MLDINDICVLIMLAPVMLVPVGLFIDLWRGRHDSDHLFDSVQPDQ